MKSSITFLAMYMLISTASAQQWTGQTSTTGNDLNSVWFTDTDNGWIVGDNSTAFRTTNGGALWTSVFLAAADLEDLAFMNPSIGLIVGDDGLVLRTTNGGETWSVVPPVTGNNLGTVAFGGGNNAYGAGRDGTIIRSTDAGASWLPVETGTARYRGSSARGLRAWCVGNLGVIRATSNGGASWFNQPSGTGSDLHSVFFIDETQGWIGGQNSMVLYSNDGGAVWTVRNSGITAGVDDIFFINGNEGWAVGDNGVVFRTTNGGLNWTPEPSTTTNDLNGVFFLDASHGWAVGNGGTVVFRGFPTGVHETTTDLPAQATLDQNYPNPFNPSTSITYHVPTPGYVALRVYNLIGNEVATLVNAHHPSGTYTVAVDGASMASGVYFYRLEGVGGTALATRRMVLVK